MQNKLWNHRVCYVKETEGYKWIVISMCFLLIFVCLGFCSSNKSLYLAPITEALHIKRSVFSLTDSLQYISQAVINLFFGALISRFGSKKLILTGLLSLMLSMSIYAYSSDILGFWLGSIFLGIGLSWTTTTMVGYVISQWCAEKQGTVTGAVLAANGLGSALATQIVSPIIYREVYGYRNAYKLIVLILLGLSIVVLLLYEDKKSGVGEKKKSVQDKDARIYSEIKKKPAFYIIIICIFLTGFILQGVYGVFPTYLKDMELRESFIVTAVSINSLTLATSKFLTGIIFDKWGLRIVTSICDVAAIVSMMLLLSITGTESGMIKIIIFVVLFSISMPLQTVMLPILAGNIFGIRAYSKILGIFVSANTIGYALSTPVMNWVFEVFGTYRPVFWACGILMCVVTISFQCVITALDKR